MPKYYIIKILKKKKHIPQSLKTWSKLELETDQEINN
jgi:hypothetical protein